VTTYASAGVSLESATSLSSWLNPRVGGLFGGMVPASALKEYDHPVLVSSMDGIGTKVRLARRLGRFEGLGQDVVHHCVNDIAVHGAQPMFFLDYLAFHRLGEEIARRIVGSIADACASVGIALAGGETAEMPLVYREGELDVAGAIVGVVEQSEIIDGSSVTAGDVVLGLPSSGAHTNGYSLIQAIFTDADYERVMPGSGISLGEMLLLPHRCYASDIQELRGRVEVHGLAHITGGGIAGNLSRVIPDGLQAVIELPPWPTLFQRIHEHGIAREEMARVFNLGIGLVAVCRPNSSGLAGGEWQPIGYIRESRSERRVELGLS